MARIPTFISQPDGNVAAQSGSPALASPDAFGAGVGDALIGVGRMVGQAQGQLGDTLRQAGVAGGDLAGGWNRQLVKSSTANGVANFDFTSEYLELQKKPRADGVSFAQTVDNAYTDRVNKYVDGINDGEVRTNVRAALMSQKPQFVSSAAQFQDKENTALDRDAADKGLSLQTNRVRADGNIDTYDDAIVKSNAVIDARPGLTDAQKTIMKRTNAERLAQYRFEGEVSRNYDNPERLSELENELTVPGSIWKERMSPEAFDRTLDRVQQIRKAANSQESTAARAALGDIKERTDKGVEVSPEEMQSVQDVVMKSKNPALMSQYASYNKAQTIYRERKDLTLEQQRELIAKDKKAKGYETMPTPVKTGIDEAFTLTGGQISQEYLAGLVNFEYGQHLSSGDYGKGTGNKTPDGKPGSDAAGVAQFTSGTWKSTIRRHAVVLGVDPNATDAQIEAMRTDKTDAGATLQVKAAAMHALDNKQEIEQRFGRSITDGDLYFAHFLGVGGATRFLSAATQNPNGKATESVAPEQVAANRGVFYDEAGRPRTNAQVRSFVANASMNNVSRVDYAGVKAATLVLNNTQRALAEDPISFASTLGRFGDVGNLSTPEGIARRGIVAGQIAEYYNIPASQFKPFTKSEAEELSKRVKDGTADEALQVMTSIAALGPADVVRAAHKQIGEKDGLFSYAASLGYNDPSQAGVASDIIRGEKKLKEDKDVLAGIGATETDLQAAFTKVVGKSLAATKLGTDTRKAAMAYYVERQIGRGGAQPGRFDAALFEESVHAVLGGGSNPGKLAVDNVNGAQTLLPRGLTGADFDNSLDKMQSTDYAGTFSKWGGPPRYADGSVISPREIAREGKFEAIGGGEYRIKMGDGKYALTGAYKDGSADFYIFRADPALMKQVLGRQATVPVKPGLPRQQPFPPPAPPQDNVP